jgi:biopolymer transport protein ExbB
VSAFSRIPTVAALALCAAPAIAQEAAPAGSDFARAADSAQQRLEQAVAELSALRASVAEEKLPLARRLSELEAELTSARAEFQQTSRTLDGRALDLTRVREEIGKLENEESYLANLFAEYARNLEAGLHIAEVQRFEQALDTARRAADEGEHQRARAYEAQAELLALSIARLDEALGGTRFTGRALDEARRLVEGDFVQVGPVAVFRSRDGAAVGVVEQRLGSLEPSLVPFGDPVDQAAAAALVVEGRGSLPFDATLGNAVKFESVDDTFLEHVRKGGPVMIPIFLLAGAALLVALSKWVGFLFLRVPSRARVQALYDAVAARDESAVAAAAQRLHGPLGRMLQSAVEHLREPRELVEEVMYENVLTSRLKLERFLPFVAISAASAPLLGLLGTVTGIINTFKVITVSGAGDVKSLSGGISEALITTEWGLIVAIPSLLLHAFLSRKARSVVGRMETTAIGLINQLGRTPWAGANGAPDLIVPAARAVRVEAPPVPVELEPARPGSAR